MKKVVVLILVVLAIFASIWVWIQREAARTSEFMNQVRSLLKDEFLPPQASVCRDIQSMTEVGRKCTPLNWSKEGLRFEFSDIVMNGRAWHDYRQYLIVKGDFENVMEIKHLPFLKADSRFTYFNEVTCTEPPHKKVRLYYNSEMLLYVFDNATVLAGLASDANGCAFPVNGARELKEGGRDLVYSVIRARFNQCYSENQTETAAYTCFVSNLNKCEDADVSKEHCYREIAEKIGPFNYSKGFELCKGIAEEELRNLCLYRITLELQPADIEIAMVACNMVSDKSYGGLCMTDVAKVAASEDIERATNICNRIGLDNRDECLDEVAGVAAEKNLSKALGICQNVSDNGYCLKEIAQKGITNNPALARGICKMIGEEDLRNWCLQGIALARANEDSAYSIGACNEITDEFRNRACIGLVAQDIVKNDTGAAIAICQNSAVDREGCLKNIAVVKSNTDFPESQRICGMITSVKTKEECRAESSRNRT